MSTRSLLPLVAVALALLCALPACGGNSGGGEDSDEGGSANLGPVLTPNDDDAPDEGGGDEEEEGEEEEADPSSSSNEVSVGPAFTQDRIFAFGDASVGGESETLSVTVRNILNAPVLVTAIDVVGTHPSDFEVVENRCSSDVELPSQETCEAMLVFSPTEPGPREAVLQITVSGGAGAQVRLSGTGIAG
jgi:hypothetical protein